MKIGKKVYNRVLGNGIMAIFYCFFFRKISAKLSWSLQGPVAERARSIKFNRSSWKQALWGRIFRTKSILCSLLQVCLQSSINILQALSTVYCVQSSIYITTLSLLLCLQSGIYVYTSLPLVHCCVYSLVYIYYTTPSLLHNVSTV